MNATMTVLKRSGLYLSIIAGLILLYGGMIAASERFAPPPSGERFSLAPHIEYFENSPGYDFDEIAGRSDIEWKKSNQKTLNFGFTRSDYWFRFHPDLSSYSELLFLEIAYPLLDFIELYKPYGDDWKTVSTGDMRPFSSREMEYRTFLFEIDPAQNGAYYIHIKTDSSLQLPAFIWKKNAFLQNMNYDGTIYGIYFGVLLIMFFYNLFIFFSVKERVYLYYVIYILSALLAQLSLYGFSAQYLWRENPSWLNQSLPVFLSIDILFGVLFCVGFLNLKTRAPILYWISAGLGGIAATLIPLTLLSGYVLAMKVAIILLVTIPFFLTGSGLYVLLKGAKTARLFLLAWVALLLGLLTTALGASGVIENSFLTDYSVQIGTALEMVLLSLALADRINIMKEEHADALKQKLAESQKVAALSDTFRKFVPVKFIEYLKKEHITQVSLGDHVEREMTILFADIRGFTGISESMTPEDNFNFLNSYLGTIGPIIRNHGGFIDKYIGDGIMALFPDSPEDAVQAGIQMLHHLNRFNADRLQKGLGEIRIGIGINTGSIMLGIIGESERMDGTVISDAVNLSSRIEGLTKVFHADLIISEAVYSRINDPGIYAHRYLGLVRVKGKKKPVPVFEVFENDETESRARKLETKSELEEGIKCFNNGELQEALIRFEGIAAKNPSDQLLKHYIGLIETKVAHIEKVGHD